MSYIKDLHQKKKDLKIKIEKLNKKIDDHPKCDSEWDKMIQELNNLNMDLEIVKSRIANYGKPRSGIEEYQIVESNK